MSKHAVVSTGSRWVAPPQGPQLVRWGSVFSGTIIAVATFVLLDALWLALSFGSHVHFFYSNLSWFIGGTAIFCLYLGGMIAGLTSGARGAGAGAMGGLTTWGLLVLVVGALAAPTLGIGHIPHTVTAGGRTYSINYLTYWSAFWSVLIGLGAAVIGGILGGITNRRVDEPYLDLQSAVAEPAVVQEPLVVPGQTVVPGQVAPGAPVVTTQQGEPTREVTYQRSVR